VSDAVRVRLVDDFDFEDAGEVELKGKGQMRSWFLTDAKDDSGTIVPLKDQRRG
jgi:hypothetical protein